MTEAAQTIESTEPVQPQAQTESRGSDTADFDAWIANSGQENPFESAEAEVDIMADSENEESDGEYEEGDETESEESEETEDESEEVDDTIIKLTIDGKEIEYDISDRERLANDLQLAHGSDKRFKEAKKLRGQALDLINKILENPEEILTNEALKARGFDFRDVAERYLYKQLQLEQMSDSERRAYENEQRIKKYEEQEALSKKQIEEQKINTLKEQYRESYQQQFISAVESTKLPKAPWVFSRMAEHMKTAIRKGYKDVTPLDVAPLVKQEWLEANRATLANVSDEELSEVLPKEMAERIRKQNIAKSKQNLFQNNAPKPNGQLKNSVKKPSVSSVYSFMDSLLK